MTAQLKHGTLALLFAASLVGPAMAHHSHNAYELTEWTTMEGTVNQVLLLNPHFFGRYFLQRETCITHCFN